MMKINYLKESAHLTLRLAELPGNERYLLISLAKLALAHMMLPWP
jgi:hypothetical protein